MLTRILAILGIVLFASVPVATRAQSVAPAMGSGGAMQRPTKDQVETAIKATNPSLRQMRTMKPMLQNYKSEVAGAPDESSKKAAAKQLMQGMMTVLTPAQQATFKQSLMSQMMAPH